MGPSGALTSRAAAGGHNARAITPQLPLGANVEALKLLATCGAYGSAARRAQRQRCASARAAPQAQECPSSSRSASRHLSTALAQGRSNTTHDGKSARRARPASAGARYSVGLQASSSSSCSFSNKSENDSQEHVNLRVEGQLCNMGEMENFEQALRNRHLSKQAMMEALRCKHRLDEKHKFFALDGPDEHIRQALLRRNPSWIENRAPGSALWDLKWNVSDAEADYRELEDGVLFNHFQHNRELTTKVGLTRNLHSLAVDERVDIDAFFPRSYDLSLASDQEDFVLDFRRSAALNTAKQHLRLAERHVEILHGGGSDQYECNVDVLRFALRALHQWIKDLDGAHLDEETESAPGRTRFVLRDRDWDALVLYSEFSDAQLCQECCGEQRRERFRGYSVSGSTVELCNEGQPRQRTMRRPMDIHRWPEFVDHFWASLCPEELHHKVHKAVEKLETIWTQMGAQGPANVWIVKPGNSSKGSGIACMNSLPEVLHHCSGQNNRIVQKYVERPLLVFDGRKFDIRQWVLVRSFEPLQAYMFSTCYLRICNEKFDLEDLSNRQRHISNWTVNRHGRHAADGAVSSLPEFRVVLEQLTGNTRCWDDVVLPKVKQVIIHCLNAVRHKVVQRSSCFELYGFDLLIDESLHPWLLEVNLSPACESRTPWIAEMLERMASRLLDILLDGQTQPDGVEPDWVCIANEVAHATTSFAPPPESNSTSAADLHCADDAGVSGDHAQVPLRLDLAIVGRPLSLRAERQFEDAWRRQGAQSLLARIARGFLGRCAARKRRQHQAAVHIERYLCRKLAWLTVVHAQHQLAALELRWASQRYLAIAHMNTGTWTCLAVSLQRRRRGLLALRATQWRRKNLAAARIQHCWHHYKVARRFCASMILQRWWHRVYLKLIACAIHVQARARQWRTKRLYDNLRARVLRPLVHMALLVGQLKWRRQAMLTRAHEAARYLQRQWRGWIARRHVASRRIFLLAIQSWRKQAATAKDAARTLQQAWRFHCEQMRLAHETRACAHIQTCWKQHRALQQKRAEAISKVNAIARRWGACLHVKRIHAAWCIRNRSQAFVARSHLVKYQKAALHIQTVWRGRKARLYAHGRRKFLERKRKWAHALAMTEDMEIANVKQCGCFVENAVTQAKKDEPASSSQVVCGNCLQESRLNVRAEDRGENTAKVLRRIADPPILFAPINRAVTAGATQPLTDHGHADPRKASQATPSSTEAGSEEPVVDCAEETDESEGDIDGSQVFNKESSIPAGTEWPSAKRVDCWSQNYMASLSLAGQGGILLSGTGTSGCGSMSSRSCNHQRTSSPSKVIQDHLRLCWTASPRDRAPQLPPKPPISCHSVTASQQIHRHGSTTSASSSCPVSTELAEVCVDGAHSQHFPRGSALEIVRDLRRSPSCHDDSFVATNGGSAFTAAGRAHFPRTPSQKGLGYVRQSLERAAKLYGETSQQSSRDQRPKSANAAKKAPLLSIRTSRCEAATVQCRSARQSMSSVQRVSSLDAAYKKPRPHTSAHRPRSAGRPPWRGTLDRPPCALQADIF